MASDTGIEKTELRQQAVAIRQMLDMEALSRLITLKIMDLECFRQAKEVLLYYPVRQELNLLPLATHHPEKSWYLPRVKPGNHLSFHRFLPDDVLETNRFGIPEPLPQTAPWEAAGLSLVLVPGLMFDRSGYRLGYGKGFYDRFLGGLSQAPVTVGAAPEALLIEQLPLEPWDLPVNWLVTENQTLQMVQAGKT